MFTGFDLLTSTINKGKSYKENNKIKLVEIIPPIFRVFVETFEWKKDVVSNNFFYYLPYLEGGEIYLENWEYKSIYSDKETYNEEEMEERGLLLIATSHRGIYLGTRGKDIDRIFSTTSSVEGSIIEIADNIFEFVRGLTDNLIQASDTAKEYRNYMSKLGLEEDDLEYEETCWKKNKNSQNTS